MLTSAAAWAAGLTSAPVYAAPQIFADGSSERCESGEGDACAALAENNPLILELQVG